MKKLFLLTAAFILFILITGCHHIPVGIAPSTEPLDPNNIEVLGYASGTSDYFSLFGIFPSDTPDFDEAIQEAIMQYPEGKALINVKIYETTTFIYIGTIHKLTVEGEVVK